MVCPRVSPIQRSHLAGPPPRPRPLAAAPRPLAAAPRPLGTAPRPLATAPRPLAADPRPLAVPRPRERPLATVLRRVALRPRERAMLCLRDCHLCAFNNTATIVCLAPPAFVPIFAAGSRWWARVVCRDAPHQMAHVPTHTRTGSTALPSWSQSPARALKSYTMSAARQCARKQSGAAHVAASRSDRLGGRACHSQHGTICDSYKYRPRPCTGSCCKVFKW